MKKLHLPVLVILAFLLSFLPAAAQTYSEAEPNNSFGAANSLLRHPDTVGASVTAGNADYFKFDLSYYYNTLNARVGTLVVTIIATNTGGTASDLKAEYFNGLQAGGLERTENIPGVAAGATVSKTMMICGLAYDDYYLAVSTAGQFNYKVFFYFSDANPNQEPNNFRSQAAEYPFSVLMENRQALQYRYRQDPNTDTVDYFKTVLPQGNYNSFTLDITAKNNSCVSGQWIRYAVYRNNSATPFSTGYVGNTPSVAAFAEVSASIPLSNMLQGDSLFIKMWSATAFGYELKYSEVNADFEDEDFDIDYEGYSAEPLAENQLKVAQVGYHVYQNGNPLYDDDGNPVVDNYDTYEFVLTEDGEMTLHVQGRNDECGQYLYYDLLDEYNNSISNMDYQQLISFGSQCNQTKSLTLKIKAIMAGTYRLRIHNGNHGTPDKMSYTLKYTFAPYVGGSTDPEPNYNQASAVPVAADETKKGYMQFISPENDDVDYYKTVLPAEASLRVYMKATYRGENALSGQYNRLTFNCVNTSFVRNIPANPPTTNLTADAVYLDTFTVAAVPQGTVYFRLYSDEAFEYEFRYEVIDALGGPNDTEPNNNFSQAQPVAEGDTTHGRLNYIVNGVGDNQDYFRTVLPSDGRVKIFVKATNTDETAQPGWDWLDLYVFDGGRHELLERRIAGNSNVPLGATIYDTLNICGVAADTIYFRFNNSQKFRYSFRFELEDTVTNNIEPDNNFTQATKLKGNANRKGTLGYVKRDAVDAMDYYKVVFGSNDVLKVKVKAINRGCSAAGMRMNFYNKSFSQFLSRHLANNSSVPIGEMVEDSVSITVTAVDTIYFRLESSTAFEYELSTGPLVPASLYSLTGDNTVCFSQQTYKAVNITDDNITYNWSLPAGGGTISFTDSIATVNWTESGNRVVQLVLTNAAGNSQARTFNVIVNNNVPTQVPVVYNFARTLSTNALPAGAGAQWFRNGLAIAGATDTSYYAALAGSYTVKFVNDCGQGPSSQPVSFSADAQAQTISFPHNAPLQMSPWAMLKLNATASSGLPIFYQLVSGNGSIRNDTLFINRRGDFIVKATQPGDDQFSPASVVYDTITVIKGDHVVSFDSIPSKIYTPDGYFKLFATSTANVNVSFSIVSGNATTDKGWLYMKGAGTVTVRAFYTGDYDYNAATPVDRTFCIGVRTLNPVKGDPAPCLATYKYVTNKIPGASFQWTLSGGGTLTTNNDTAYVQWQTPGTHTLTVKANSGCDPVFSEEQQFTVTTSNNLPAQVTGMLPADHAVDQQLPLKLSWVPGSSTTLYDLYVWDSAGTMPAVPYKANLADFTYTLPMNSFPYNKTYKWKIVSKNPCSSTQGPVQHFRIIPLPDLVVSDVQAPANANSGQTITVSWKVTNAGPGRTFTDQTWTDAVFFSFDTIPNFRGLLNWNPYDWTTLLTPVRPLLVGTKQNVSSLESGGSYTNSMNFTLPPSYGFPVYVYVMTGWRNSDMLQESLHNDTARAPHAMVITLSPTPDLRVDTVFTPSTTFSGSTIKLTYKVKNYGVVTPAGEGWADSVFISQNPLFDRAQAIPLMHVKKDTSYYPNARRASVYHNTQVLPDSTYTKSVDVVIPNFIFGTWFVYVQANSNTSLYEGALSNNNINRSQLQVYLTPTPKLVVNTLNVPVSAASTTQPIGINWNVLNEGFTDNIERNKGHYFLKLIGHCPCHTHIPNSVCVGAPIYKDSMVLGSSYWVDKVYLSKDPNGLNVNNAVLLKEVNHGIENSGLLLPLDPQACPSPMSGAVNVHNVIKPGLSYPKTLNFNVPSNLESGDYYVYVHTNSKKTVFEYPGTPQIKRSAASITVSRPDLSVPEVTVPSNSTGGDTLTVNYTVLNNGPGTVFKHVRRDRLYISNFPSFDASAIVVGTQTFTEDLPVGTPVQHNFRYAMPATASGNKYFYVRTNFDSAFQETNHANNVSASAGTLVAVAAPNDLVVSSVQLKDTVFTHASNSISYTVSNNGTGTTAGTWTDSLFISCSPTYSRATSYFVAVRKQSRKVAGGGNYTDTFSFTIPKMSYELNNCFPQTAFASAYFYIKANADTATYEGNNLNNNVSAATAKTLANPLVDHIVVRVNGPDAATVGRPYPIAWTLKNIGYQPAYKYYSSYSDGVYFSPDSVFNNNAVQANTYLKYSLIDRNDTLNDAKQAVTPNVPTGDYYVFVYTDQFDAISGEKVRSNNINLVRDASGKAKKVHVTRPALPDLRDSIISAPSIVAAGQPVVVIHKITNYGTGETYPASWIDELHLSPDFVVTNALSDRLLKTKQHKGVLQPGQWYLDTMTAVVPANTPPGNYVLIATANETGIVFESDHGNNTGLALISVYTPLVSDLITRSVVTPDTVYLGYTLDTVRWIVKNESPNPADGFTKDGLYLSVSSTLDSNAALIGIKEKRIDMPALDSDTMSMAPLVDKVIEGNYYVLVKTDLTDNMFESDKTNNVLASANPVYVKVKELKLGIPEANTMARTARYYKLVIPDGLQGATIKISLKTNDSTLVRNEMFVGEGYIPDAARHNFKFETPNYGNQQIIMTSVTDTIYYIRVNCVSPNPPTQNITLKAEILPFSIQNVHTNSGGNIGNVTIRINGSLYVPGMTAKLTRGATTIHASAVYFTNNTVVYATFNLKGQPLGIYDVTLTKPNNETATLAGSFSVVTANNGGLITGGGPNTGAGNGNEPGCDPGASSGLNSQLVVEMIVPPSALINRPVVIVINYSNPTNYDIPAQTRMLFSEEGAKMALTRAGVPTGTTALYLEIVEPGGPPGVIRAGGSGTILVYSVAPGRVPPDGSVLFRLQ